MEFVDGSFRPGSIAFHHLVPAVLGPNLINGDSSLSVFYLSRTHIHRAINIAIYDALKVIKFFDGC
jgi:hypothetical protein